MGTIMLTMAVMLSLAGMVPSAQDVHQTTISGDEIHSAITRGLETEPSPYLLKSIYPRNVKPAALVYTPAIRIALSARRAVAGGMPYRVADIDRETASPLVHVVVSATNVSPKREVPAVTEAHPVRMEVVQRPDHRLLASPEAESALWVSHQRDRTEPLLVGTQTEGVIVGAFERRQLCAGCYVIAYRMHKEGTKTSVVMAIAHIRGQDVDSWR